MKEASHHNELHDQIDLDRIDAASPLSEVSCPNRLTPGGLLRVELLTRENFAAANEVLFEAFPDESAQTDIETILGGYIEGECECGTDPEHHSEGYVLHEQFVYYDDVGDAVAVGGIYHDNRRPPTDMSLNWIGVRTSERRKGYGSEILRHLEEVSRLKGFDSLSVWKEYEPAPSPEYRMYAKFGMAEEEENRFSIVWGDRECTEMWLSKCIPPQAAISEIPSEDK